MDSMDIGIFFLELVVCGGGRRRMLNKGFGYSADCE